MHLYYVSDTASAAWATSRRTAHAIAKTMDRREVIIEMVPIAQVLRLLNDNRADRAPANERPTRAWVLTPRGTMKELTASDLDGYWA